MIRKFTTKLNEDNDPQNLNNNDGILIIVDVQKSFDNFTPQNYEQNVFNYCKKFPKSEGKGVYQIWDANKTTNPSYQFPNQIGSVKKYYGTKFDDKIKQITQRLENKYNNLKEGEKFKLKDSNSYLVRINNNHKWFYVNEELYNLFEILKGKKVVLIGGAGNECLKDIEISMKQFGITPIYNHDYIYDATTNDNQVSTPKE